MELVVYTFGVLCLLCSQEGTAKYATIERKKSKLLVSENIFCQLFVVVLVE